MSVPRWYRRHPVLAALVVVLAILATADRLRRGPVGADDDQRYHNRVFAVARVVDGDTLDIAAPDGSNPTTRVRLWGVDAPELGGPRGREHFGPEASDFTHAMLGGRRVRLELLPRRTRDRYQRLLAYVFLEGEDVSINARLLAEGYAYADRREAHDHPLAAEFARLEDRARRSRAGLWRDAAPGGRPVRSPTGSERQ